MNIIDYQINNVSSNPDLLTDDEDETTTYDGYMKNRTKKEQGSRMATSFNNDFNGMEKREQNNIKFQFQFKNSIELELTTTDMTELSADGVVNLCKYNLDTPTYGGI